MLFVAHIDTYSVANLTALFGCTVDMPHANESEARMNNTTRAEVFAGVLRAYRSSSTAAADAGTNAGTYLPVVIKPFSPILIFGIFSPRS